MRKICRNDIRYWILCLFLILLSVCVCILSCQLYGSNSKKVSKTESFLISPADTSFEQRTSESPLFHVLAWEGIVKVEDLTEEDTCILLKNIDVRTMRNADRERFETGFYLYSEEELAKLLEDYSS